ncbi:AGAP001594-PA-like protein [Anopheles sinensis]|uniref:AGAP001594-PA-like protein n=1 Tax=Anopheles sinensis TaxID=74873 RepID=A0A084VD34_ANOSI|nr:AGAP001594-PA-like protein [Anopheles sinensis]
MLYQRKRSRKVTSTTGGRRCKQWKSPYRIDFEHFEKHYFVIPIHNKDRWYKACNKQINREWKRVRGEQLKSLEHCDEMPSSLTLASGWTDRVQVLALCSISRIPSCAKRCLLEVIVTQDYCYYLNIEHIFVSLRDQNVFRGKFRYTFTRNLAYRELLEWADEPPKGVSKFILAGSPREWIEQQYASSEEDLYNQRQNCYYYYYYNEEEDDDTYQDYYNYTKKRVAYDGPPPPTSNEPYFVVPIHRYPELKEQCVRLINTEWPRSRMARFWSFETSTDTLPITFVLTQLIDGEIVVLGHAKVSPVPADDTSAYVESVVVDYRYRGRGIGTHLMNEIEKYCKTVMAINHMYIATDGQEVFYAKLGYIFCKAINIFGTRSTRNTVSKKHWMRKVLSDWEPYPMGYGDAVEAGPEGSEPIDVQPPEKICVDQLIWNIRNIVYNQTGVTYRRGDGGSREEKVCDLLIKMHAI